MPPRQVVSLMKNEQQNKNVLLKSRPALYFSQKTFFKQQEMFLLWDKLITQSENGKHRPKTCNEIGDKNPQFIA